MDYIKTFEQINLKDTALVGGKNASLGQLTTQLTSHGLLVPRGFALTTDAYHEFLSFNSFIAPIEAMMQPITDADNLTAIQKAGTQARALLLSGSFPPAIIKEINESYTRLCDSYHTPDLAVAVRSSATAEDLPTASFAGQQESYLNVRGIKNVLDACKKSIASLFTDRAICYRLEQGFGHLQVAISVGVQKMVRADIASSGVAFSLDTETGFREVITINGAFGLGETIVQGMVIPDEFLVHKPTLAVGFNAIIKKQCGTKTIKAVYTDHAIANVPVEPAQQRTFCLNEQEIITIAKQVVIIEKHYSDLNGQWTAVDVEWAKDGIDGAIYIVQARTETIHSRNTQTTATTYHLKTPPPPPLVTGQSIGQAIASGRTCIMRTINDAHSFNKGDILVTTMTNPDWTPIMAKAAAIITEQGGRTCHAAIVSRELGLPALVGALGATTTLKNNELITLDCSVGQNGSVYEGALPFDKVTAPLAQTIPLPIPIMLNIADPSQAFTLSFLPVAGVGLARIEFIIAQSIGMHPMAAIHPERITDKNILSQITEKATPYGNLKTFFIKELSYGIGTIAAAFYPKPVIVRLSDFKSNEYSDLKGGIYFEQSEDNPMLGFRGASRYCSPAYKEAFALECAALKEARNTMGLTNIILLIPFVRTINEAHATLLALKENGLERGVDGLKIFIMCEVPSNVMLIDDYCLLFDGFSIGSNDLTQLTLGIDRNSAVLAQEFNEQDPAMQVLYKAAIAGSHRHKKPISCCGQGPSEFPEFADFLIKEGIDSLSFDRDGIVRLLGQ